VFWSRYLQRECTWIALESGGRVSIHLWPGGRTIWLTGNGGPEWYASEEFRQIYDETTGEETLFGDSTSGRPKPERSNIRYYCTGRPTSEEYFRAGLLSETMCWHELNMSCISYDSLLNSCRDNVYRQYAIYSQMSALYLPALIAPRSWEISLQISYEDSPNKHYGQLSCRQLGRAMELDWWKDTVLHVPNDYTDGRRIP